MRPRNPANAQRPQRIEGPWDVVLLMYLGVWLILLPGLVKALPLRSLLRLLTPRATGVNPQSEQAEKLRRYTDALLNRLRSPNRCLIRTLLLFRLLRQAGWPVQFCVGIRYDSALPEAGPVQGHAWLLCRGKVFLEPAAEAIAAYRTTFRYPQEAAQLL